MTRRRIHTLDALALLMFGVLAAAGPRRKGGMMKKGSALALLLLVAPVSAHASCLDGAAQRVTLAGRQPRAYDQRALPPKTGIDAGTAVWSVSPSLRYPFKVGGDDLCVVGGRFMGTFSAKASWQDLKTINHAAIFLHHGARPVVEGVAIENVHDAIRPVLTPDWTIRGVRLTYIRDDCVENDHLWGGLIEDSLFDGCYVAISARPSPAILDAGYTGRGKIIAVRRSLIRMQPMPKPYKGTDPGHGPTFKLDADAPRLAITDTIFRLDQAASHGESGLPGREALAECARNTLVWLGTGSPPGNWPPACVTVRTGADGLAFWNAAVADWTARLRVAGH